MVAKHPDAVVSSILSAGHASRQDLGDLSLAFSRLSGDQSSLMQLLAGIVQRALHVNLLADVKNLYKDQSPSEMAKHLDKWLVSEEGASKFHVLRDGLEAATIVAGIAALDDIDPRSINEDALQASVTLLQGNLTNHLVPALTKAPVKEHMTSPDRKRRRIPTTVPAKDLKKVYTLLLTTTNLQQILVERMGQVVSKVSMDVQQTLHLTTGAVRTLEMDSKPAYQLQLAATTILTETFRRYPSQRDSIIDELLSAIPDIPKRRSYEIRYSSATASTALQEFNRKSVGSLLSLKNHIHILSAILIQLVQACVLRPTYTVSEDDQKQFQSGLGTCQAVSDAIVNMILFRCRKAKSGSNTDSYRSMLSSMVEDWLLVLLIPEYPGARFLVASIQNILISRDLAAASSVFGKQQQSFEPTYLNTAFDVLGKICAVQARIRSVAKTKPVRITRIIHMSPSSEDQEVDCLCSSTHNSTFLIQCDHCNRLYHGGCVGIPNRDAVPNAWICDACCLMNIQSREHANLSNEDAKAIDLSYVMHHSFQAMTAHRLGLDIDDAVRFHLAVWVEKLHKKKVPFRLPASLLDNWDKQGIAAEPLSDEGVVRVVLNLVAEELPFKKPIGFLLKVMEDKHAHALRKLALKVIDNVVKGDPGVMMMPVVTKAVSKRLADDSISVREGAVHLVGDFIAQSPRSIQGFQSALIPCLTDPGVSVRKRAVRIFEQILKNSPSFSGRASVCSIMLERSVDPKEEDGVRDLIESFFASLWLENGQEVLPRKRSRSEDSITPTSVPGLVTPTTPKHGRPGPVRRVNATAEQMMEVVRIKGSGDHLAALLKKLLTAGVIDADSTRKISERKKRQELGMDHCKDLIAALFELLIQLDENRETKSLSVGKDIAATLETIAVFCTVYPYPVAKHIETMLPYLKADNGVSLADEAAIVAATCKIISQVAPELEGSIVLSLSATSLSRDLCKICYRFGQSVLCKAVEAFTKLAQLSCGNSHFMDSLMGMVSKLYSFLMKNVALEDLTGASSKIRSGVFRGLTVLGHVCTHIKTSIEWDTELESDDLEPLSSEQLDWSVMLISCYRVFSKFLQKKDTATRCQALSAFKGLFLSQPQLLLNLDHRGLFDDVMSDRAPSELQQEALECWRSILMAEEERIDSGEAAATMDADGKVTVSKRVSGDQNGDATVFGSVLNKHSHRLFKFMQCADLRLRSLALDLIGVALRQGLLNPNEVVPHLFALQGDIEHPEIRSSALQLLVAEGEKRPDILRQRMRAGVKEAFNFQRRIRSKKESRASAVVVHDDGSRHCIFSKIFEQSIVQNRKLREGLYKSLLKLFELDRSHVVHRGEIDVSMLAFVSEVLASLPYQSARDPLLIIHCISEIISLQGQQLCDRFADFLRPHGLASEDEFDDTISEEDPLEKAAKNHSNECEVLSSQAFNMDCFRNLCKEGFVLVLLVRLKTFLRSRYNLSIARCLEFDPNAAERPSDKTLLKAASLKNIDVCQSFDETSFKDGGSLVRLYALFRRSLREDIFLSNDSDQVDGQVAMGTTGDE